MARSVRFFGKKRGHRRTGSKKLASAGEALFFLAFLVIGCGGLVVMIATLVVPELRANHEFAQSTCVVLDARVNAKQGEDGTLYRPEVKIEYQVDGRTYRVWTYDIHTVQGRAYSAQADDARAIADRFAVGQEFLVYYDPADPTTAVLLRGSSWWVWFSFLVPVSFILIGGGGLIYRLFRWGKSAERQAVMAKRAADLTPFANNGIREGEFPNVPVAAAITDSPGTKLAFRLPSADSPAWRLVTWSTVCVLWNGIVAIFVTVALRGFLRGHPDWVLTLFIVPFVLIGIGLIVFLFRQVALTAGIGPTLVEISDQPLHPGGCYELFLSQTGRLRMNSLEMLLVCEEETTFRHGTDTRTETRSVFEQSLFQCDEFEVRPSAPFEVDCELPVPAGVMHSFKSGHNEITWRVVVKGSATGWPDFRRSFPIIISPGSNGNPKP